MLVAITASAAVGQYIVNGDLIYLVTDEKYDNTGTVEVRELSSAGKAAKNLNLVIPSTIGNEGYTYTVTELAEKAFEEEKNIVSVEFNDGIKRISNHAFYNCSNLSKITINSKTIDSIEGYAFFGTAITTLHIPASVTYFENTCVNNCDYLTSITVDEANSKYSSLNGLLYDKEKTILYRCPPGIKGNLLEKDFPYSLTEIWGGAFGYSKLKKLYLPYGITTIHGEAFSLTYFDELKIPSTVTKFYKDAFYFCAARELYMAPREAPEVSSDDFFGVAVLGNLHVPSGRKPIYKMHTPWSKFPNIYEDAFDFSGYALFSSKDAQGKDIYYGECRFCVLVVKKYGTPAVTLTHISNVNLPVGAGDAAVNVYQQPGGYLIDGAKKYFWKPTSSYNLSRGYAYLKLDEATAGSTSRVYVDLWPYTPTPDFKTGDVNGDGKIDVADINVLIDIILNLDDASKYNGRADVNNDTKVDVADINQIIDMIL